MSLRIVRHLSGKHLLRVVAVLTAVGMGRVSSHADTDVFITNPVEYLTLQGGNKLINDEINSQIALQTSTAMLQGTITGEFYKIRDWEKQYNGYLKQANGYASSLKASTTVFNEGVRIFMSLVKLREAVKNNPQGIFATMSMNNIYMETATEMVSVFTLLKTAVAQGGEHNMLTGAERSETLWAINDKIRSFHKKLQKLTLSIQYYTMSDVWSSATAGMIDRDNGAIAKEAKARWKRVARSIH